MRIPFEVLNNRKNIMGIMNIPFCFTRSRTFVILCYGMNGNRVEAKRLFVHEADFLEKRGIAFVRFDYTGLGMSDGDFFEANIDTKVEDTIKVITYIRNCCYKEKHQIILMGISDGAKVINKLVIENKIKIDDIIFVNPVVALLDNKDEEDSGDKKKNSILPIVKHPSIGKMSILKEGQFFSHKYMKQCSERQELFDIKGKNVISFFSIYDKLSLSTKLEMQKKNYYIREIESCSHVFAENEAQVQLFTETYNWISKLS
ncbi:alpha/beta hydrolase [Lachnospiraceae bacterium 48-33]